MTLIKKREFWYYFFLIAGGLWHILDVFQDIMSITSGSVMILISLLAVYDSKTNIIKEKTYLNYLLNVAFLSFLAEWVGTMKGWLFGDYMYGSVLIPSFMDIPIAIGFAWVSTLILSTALVNNLIEIKNNMFGNIVKALATGFLMTLFDFIMEPAAVKLSYWKWVGDEIPVFNYITWFGLGTLFAFYGYYKDLLINVKSMKMVHLYFAQLIYFLLVIAS